MNRYRFRTLTPEDIDALSPLHRELVGAVRRGFLDPRPREELLSLLTDGASVNMGLFDGGRMIGYSLAKAMRLRDLDLAQNLVPAGDGREMVSTGRGMGVLPEYRGQSLGTAVHAAHAEAIRRAGMAHYFGRIVVDNFPSIAAIVKASSVLHGFDRDRFGLNFAFYSGTLIDGAAFPGDDEARADDLAHLRGRFEKGYIVHSCAWDEASGIPVFSLAPLFPA